MLNRTATALALVAFTASCSSSTEPEDDPIGAQMAADESLFDDRTPNALGHSSTVSINRIVQDSTNPFFRNMGVNGRNCGSCHLEELGWTVTPEYARTLPARDPLFLFDGSDCLPPGTSNANPGTNSTLMLSKALVRVELPIPATADYTLAGFNDPLRCATPPSAAKIRNYRRPLPSANTFFLSTVMWDGRENVNPPNNTTDLIRANMAHQANDANRTHAQATADATDAIRQSIVSFQNGIFNAQQRNGFQDLNGAAANGGAAFLYTNTRPNFFIGINDVLNCAIPNSCAPGRTATFTSQVFTIFKPWETNPPNDEGAAVGRGEIVFNTKSFPIDNVPGLNGPRDTIGLPSPFTGFCGSCHDSPNIGNHSTSLPIDIGISAQFPVGGLDVARLPTYTFREKSSGQTLTVTDPGRGLITGKFSDLGKMKGPNLRNLASRAPYFHNGSARDLNAVVNFYNTRFNIGFTPQEQSDLVAFLQAL
ncbi:hypothetical protein [Pendulispora albinea]|uniref:Cytochrome c domain-containing protein n=1 Tax=Pendulispora albinea TaxID=2741071 RepID=A0ABZ2MBU6_9BACT